MEKLVKLATIVDANEAYIIKGLLASEGVEAWIFDEHAAAFIPFVIGGLRLVVKQSDLEKAKGILSQGQTSHEDGV